MRLIAYAVANLVLATFLLPPNRGEAQEQHIQEPRTANFWRAAGGVVVINGLIWSYNWYVQRWHWANVGTRAWWNNLRNGFVWDDDDFMANQLAHPYHGSLYFNAARGSRYGFWSSSVFTLAGSLTWELFTENVRPSLNDLINTTLGGIALGEATFRFSSLLVGSGTKARLGRAAGAFLLNPVGSAQNLLNGGPAFGLQEYTRPHSGRAFVSVGRHTSGSLPAGELGPSGTFMELTANYGDPFAAGSLRPYDVFDFKLRLSPNHRGLINQVAVSGLLTREVLQRTDRSQLSLGIYQHYDYEDLSTFRAGSQSLGAGLLFRRNVGGRTDLSLGVQLEAIPLGAVSSDYDGVRNRDYDYGVGGGGRVTGSLRYAGRSLLRFDGRSVWIHSLYGADADHVTTTARLSALVPLLRGVGVGGDVGVTFRRSVYRDQPRALQRIPEIRAYLVWAPF